MQKTNVSWRLFAVLGVLGVGGALFAPGCTVTTTDDDDLDVDAGVGGTNGTAGSKATGGSAGSSAGKGGSAGSSAGTGGATGGSGGSGGSAPMMACGDETVIPYPNCEADDADDECTTCLKAKCCEPWRECLANDATAGDHVCGWGDWGGAVDSGEIGCVIECMRDGATDVGDCTGECMASSWENSTCTDGTVTDATNELIGCIVEPDTTCELECFQP